MNLLDDLFNQRMAEIKKLNEQASKTLERINKYREVTKDRIQVMPLNELVSLYRDTTDNRIIQLIEIEMNERQKN